MSRVLVTGGAGYVGAELVPYLLRQGHQVKVLDLYMFGDNVLSSVKGHPGLEEIKGDIRDQALFRRSVQGCDAVIHLACISNDPSFELDPTLGRSINYAAFRPMVRISKESGIRRFIYASSSSVYGVSDAPDITEEQPLNPITDYSKFKALCEPELLAEQTADFIPVVLRPATVCGYSPRLRLDLSVNILTNLAVNSGKITIFGGTQKRPNIHIADLVELYELLLRLPDDQVAGKIYNAGYQNLTIAEIAGKVRDVVQSEMPGREEIALVTTPTNDLRSYHISSGRIKRELGYEPRHTIEDAVRDLVQAFRSGRIPDAMADIRYYNIKTMQTIKLG